MAMIELAGIEQGRDVGTDAELDLQPDGGIAGAELAEQRGQNMEIEIVGCADADQAAAVAPEPLLGLLEEGEDAPRIGQQHLALLGELDAARVAQDELRADLILEALDVKADRRLREIDLARSLGEAAGVADGDEGAQQDRVVKHQRYQRSAGIRAFIIVQSAAATASVIVAQTAVAGYPASKLVIP